MKYLLIFLFVGVISAAIPVNVYAAQDAEESEECDEANGDECVEEGDDDEKDNIINKALKFTKKTGRKVEKKVKEKTSKSKSNREEKTWSIHGSYSLIEMWIPSKIGLSASYIVSPASTWELEYMRGAVSLPYILDEIGSMTEQRFTLLYRRYGSSNSFNFLIGADYYRFRINLGDVLIAKIAGANSIPSIDLLKVESVGLLLGLGNRWHFKSGFSLGIDWLVIDIPVVQMGASTIFLDYATDPNDRKTVEDVLTLIKYLPRLTTLRVQAGFSF